MIEGVVSFLVGGAVGAGLSVLAQRLRAYRIVLFLLRSLRDSAADEESVVEELEKDHYFARDYARPSDKEHTPIAAAQ